MPLSRHKQLSSLQRLQHKSLELIHAALSTAHITVKAAVKEAPPRSSKSDLQLLEMLSNSCSYRQKTDQVTQNLPPTGSTKKL